MKNSKSMLPPTIAFLLGALFCLLALYGMGWKKPDKAKLNADDIMVIYQHGYLKGALNHVIYAPHLSDSVWKIDSLDMLGRVEKILK